MRGEQRRLVRIDRSGAIREKSRVRGRMRALEIFVRLADKRLPGSRDGRDHGGVAHICASAESNQKCGIAKQMQCEMRDASSFLDSIISGENAKWVPVDRSRELHARSVPEAILFTTSIT